MNALHLYTICLWDFRVVPTVCFLGFFFGTISIPFPNRKDDIRDNSVLPIEFTFGCETWDIRL